MSSIPEKQRAAVITKFGAPLEIKSDYPVLQQSSLKPGECLIKLEYSGVCHSDLHVRDGDWERQAPIPIVGGHEGVGHIVAIGEHTVNSHVKVGDRVGAKWIANVCFKCEMCRKGHESSCLLSMQKVHGYQIDGTFKEYLVSYTDYVTPIPENLSSSDAAPILCAGLTVYKALRQTQATVGQWVAISGAGGGLGHLAVQYAKAMGFRVCAIDTGAEKESLVKELGADAWVDFATSSDLVLEVQKATFGGPAAAVVSVGSPKPFEQAIQYLAFKGVLVCLGMPGGGATMQLPLVLTVAKSLTILGSAIGNRQDVTEALDLASRGKVKCHYTVRPLEDVNNALDDMSKGKIAGRVVLKIQQ